MPMLRPGAQPFRPEPSLHNPPPPMDINLDILDVDFSTDDQEIDAWFKSYISDKGFYSNYYQIIQENVYDFKEAIDKFTDTKFKVGDYLIIANHAKTKYSVYIYSSYGWISFRGKNAYDTSEGDVDIIIDPDDD